MSRRRLTLFASPPLLLFGLWVGWKDSGVISYILHNPDALTRYSLTLFMQNSLWPMLILAALSLIFVGVGDGVLIQFDIPSGSPLYVLFCFGMGLGVMAWFLWILGLMGYYRLGM